jgi:hypothetical protein
MYVASVPNRDSPPAILLRESFRLDGKVKTRTIANISHLPAPQIEALRVALKGGLPPTGGSLPDSFVISRSRPHGHAAAVLGSLRKLHLDSILDSHPSRQRDLVIAMIVARILDPASKLATARGLHSDTLHSSLGELLDLNAADETELYAAMDWLLPRQVHIEKELARRQLADGALVLYDLTSTYFEGRHCPLAKLGHSRDDKSGKPQIVFGLLTNAAGCPVAVEVFAGNTSDPKTVATQVDKLRHRFGLRQVVLVGDRGMITSTRIREDLPASHGIEWISALRATQIQKLARDGRLQMSLFDKTDLVEIAHPDFPGERLIACFNPLLAEERARKRPDLLSATEKQLEKIAVATRRQKRPLRGKQNIGLRAGKILNRYKMGKHFELRIEEVDRTRLSRALESLVEAPLDLVVMALVRARARGHGFKQGRERALSVDLARCRQPADVIDNLADRAIASPWRRRRERRASPIQGLLSPRARLTLEGLRLARFGLRRPSQPLHEPLRRVHELRR